MATKTHSPLARQIGGLFAGADPNGTLLRYDRDSDTLMVHFRGRAVPATSVPVLGGRGNGT